MFAQRERRRRELLGTGAPPPDTEPCPACGGRIGLACERCEGAGWVKTAAEREREETPDRLPDDLAESCGEFLLAWSQVERHGVDGWMRLAGIDSAEAVHPGFGDALAVFGAELDRLEHERDVVEAEERRRADAARSDRRR